MPEHKLQPHPRSQRSNVELPPPQPRCFLEKKFLSRSTTRRKIVPLSFGCSLFHWPICTDGSSADLLFPFVSLREQRPKIIGWINPKMKSNRKEKGKKKEIIKEKNSTRHHSRKSSLSIRRRSRIARFNEKTADFPPNPIFFFAESRSSVGKSVENVVASVGSEEGELRKKTRFFNLPVARTWLHAYVCKAAPKKVRRIRGTNVAVLGRGSLPRIRTTVVSPVEKTLKL